MLPPSRFWRGMFPDIGKLPLGVLAWERIGFRRGVGFGVEIQVSTPKLDIGVELLMQLRFHQKYRTLVKNMNFRLLSDGFGETCDPTVRCESFLLLHRPLKFT